MVCHPADASDGHPVVCHPLDALDDHPVVCHPLDALDGHPVVCHPVGALGGHPVDVPPDPSDGLPDDRSSSDVSFHPDPVVSEPVQPVWHDLHSAEVQPAFLQVLQPLPLALQAFLQEQPFYRICL